MKITSLFVKYVSVEYECPSCGETIGHDLGGGHAPDVLKEQFDTYCEDCGASISGARNWVALIQQYLDEHKEKECDKQRQDNYRAYIRSLPIGEQPLLFDDWCRKVFAEVEK